MNILLIAHECPPPYGVFPYGLGYLAAALQQAGHKVTVFDQADSRCSNEDLYALLKSDTSFDFVGMGFQAAYFNVAARTCSVVRNAAPNLPLVLGGSAPSASPDYFFHKFDAHCVLTGEADESVIALIEALSGETSFDNVPGLYWTQDGQVRSSPRAAPPADLDSLSFPAWDLFDMNRYTFPTRRAGVDGFVRSLGILTSRGCPYACKFCYRMEKGYRARSVESCLEEIRQLIKRYDVRFIAFHDDLFMLNKQRTLEFCDAISRSGLHFNWLCNGRFNIADREQLRAMKAAGCVEISYGLESGDQSILDEMDKRITVEQIREVAAITKEEGMLVTVPAMFGLPGETAESLRKTVDAIIATTSWHHKRTIRPMQPYPGSYYWSECVRKGLIKDEDDFYARFFSSEKWTVNLTQVPDEEFDKHLYRANAVLLEEFYRRQLRKDLEMFRNVYFDNSAAGFVPMR